MWSPKYIVEERKKGKLILLIICLFIGVLVGWKHLLPKFFLSNSGKIITIALIFLLITMGLKIGFDREMISHLGEYGFEAFVFAIMTIFLSLVFVGALEKIFVKKITLPKSGQIKVENDTDPHPYRMTVIIVSSFFLGIILGYAVFPSCISDYLPTMTNAALYFTLLAVGIDLGQNKEIWKQLIGMGKFVFLVPFGVATGSILAGMLIGPVFGWKFLEGGAVGAGFGWYSLSGVIITELHSVNLGTIAFLSNVFREIITIIITPFLASRVGQLTLVAPGGATTMDTTLPIITAAGPPGTAVIAFINGVVLSTLVPILVPLLLS